MNQCKIVAPGWIIGLSSLILFVTGCGNSVDIWTAVETEDLDAIKRYVQTGGDLETGKHRKKKTPLLQALKFKKRESYKLLLELGADPNTICRSSGRAVVFEAACQEDEFWLREALMHGGNPNLVREDGHDINWLSPLKNAIGGGYLNCVKILMEYGADIEMIDPMSGTALSMAAQCNKYEIVLALLESGAKYRVPTLETSRFIFTIQQHHKSKFQTEDSKVWIPKVVELLKADGVDLDKVEFDLSSLNR